MTNGETFGTDSGVGSTIALLEAQLPGARERRSRLEEELAAAVALESAITSVLEGLRSLSGTPLDGGTEQHADLVRAPEPAPIPASSGESTGAVADVVADAVAGPSGPDVSAASPAPAAKPARKTTGRRPATRATAKKATARKAAAVKKATSGKPAAVSGAAPGPAKSDAPATVAATKKSARRSTPKDTASKAATTKAAAAAEEVADAPGPATAAAAPSRRRLTDAEAVLTVLSRATGPLRAHEVAGLLDLDSTGPNINALRTRLERLVKTGQAQRPGRGLYTVAADRSGSVA